MKTLLFFILFITTTSIHAQNLEEAKSEWEHLYHNMATQAQQGNLEKALEFGKECLEVAIRDSTEQSMACIGTKMWLNTIYAQLKKNKEADKEINDAVELSRVFNGAQSMDFFNICYTAADYYKRQKNYEKATVHYTEVTAILSTTKDSVSYQGAVIWAQLMDVYYQQKDYKKAQKVLDYTLKLYKNVMEPAYLYPEYRLFLYQAMDIVSITKNYKKGVKVYRAAVEMEQEEGGALYGKYCGKLGYTYEKLNQNQLAADWKLESAKAFRKVYGANSENAIVNQFVAAVLYLEMNEYKKAASLLMEISTPAKEVMGDTSEEYDHVLYYWNKAAKSLKDDRMLIKIAQAKTAYYKKRDGVNHINYARSLSLLGAAFADVLEIDKAESYYTEALRILEKVEGKKTIYIDLLLGAGMAFYQNSSYSKAMFYFKQALDLTQKNNKKATEKEALIATRLAQLSTHRNGQHTYTYCLNAMEICQKSVGEKHIYYIELLELKAHEETNKNGENEYPRKNLLKALKLYKELGQDFPRTHNSILMSLARLEKKSGALEKAKSYYEESLAIFGKGSKGKLTNDKSKNALQVPALRGLATIALEEEDYETAEDYFLEALKISEETYGKSHSDYSNNKENLALIQYLVGDKEAAFEHLKVVIDLKLNQLHRNFYQMSEEERKAFVLDEVDFLKVMLGTFDEERVAEEAAFAILLQDIVLATKDITLEGRIDILEAVQETNDEGVKKLYTEWKKKYSLWTKMKVMRPEEWHQLGYLEDTPSDLLMKINELENKISNKLAQIRPSFKEKQRTKFAQLSKKIKADEAAVDFIQLRKRTRRIAEKGDTIQYYALVTLPQSEAPAYIYLANNYEIESFLETEVGLNTGSYVDDDLNNEDLYSLIWEPLEELLGDVKTVHISSTGLLKKIAFGALLNSDGNRLVNAHKLHFYGSMRYFIHHKKKQFKSKEVLLLGGIKYDINAPKEVVPTTDSSNRGTAFAYLPGTKREVNTIGRLLKEKDWNYEVVLGAKASEEYVKSLEKGNTPRILHIATHGFFSEYVYRYSEENRLSRAKNRFSGLKNIQDPLLRSGLLLANCNLTWKDGNRVFGKEDGILTAREVANMDLSQTEMVVLSACETGTGDIKSGGDIYGLQRAFKAAGVDKLIISLWKVPDRETSKLMELFYQNFLEGQTASEAFRNAQLSMQEKYKNPYFWAAFILVE